MPAQVAQQYLKTRVLTASQEMLQLMLWDGAIRFAEQGREGIIKKEIEASHNALLKSQKIVMELRKGLKHDLDPDLCGKLDALYMFIYRRLVDANMKRDASAADDALQIMRHQRETWALLIDQLTKEKSVAVNGMENIAAASGPESDLPMDGEVLETTFAAQRPTVVKPMQLPRYGGTRPAGLLAGLSVQG
jgi:flagellar protein FliS